MKLIFSVVFVGLTLSLLASVGIAEEQERIWTDIHGKQMLATCLSMSDDGASVRLRRQNWEEVAVPLARLSISDRQYMARHQAFALGCIYFLSTKQATPIRRKDGTVHCSILVEWNKDRPREECTMMRITLMRDKNTGEEYRHTLIEDYEQNAAEVFGTIDTAMSERTMMGESGSRINLSGNGEFEIYLIGRADKLAQLKGYVPNRLSNTLKIPVNFD